MCALLRGGFSVNSIDLSTGLNRSLLRPASGLLKFPGNVGDLAVRNMFPGIKNLYHVHGECYLIFFFNLKNVIVNIDAEFFS